MELLTSKLLTCISVPAMNKWTKVAPCVRHVAVLQSFCNLVPQACKELCPPPEDDSGSEDEGAAVGVPVDESKAWRKLARLRVRKACFFLSDQQSNWMTCYLFMVRAGKSGHEGAFCTFQARNLAL